MNAATAPATVEGSRNWHVWRAAIRPKTLPAAVAPIAVGCGVAIREDGFDPVVAAAALIVAVLLQIAANLANDLFDHRRGADVERLGPVRVTASGLVSERQMLRALGVTLTLAVAAGLVLVIEGGWPILILGVVAILCAVAYTAGPFPLGYHGLGDLFVFLFFGLVGVAGSAYVQTGHLTRLALLAALPVGFLATAIIVVNNLRDLATDRAAGKHTLAVRIGRRWTIVQFRALLVAALIIPPLLWILGESGGAVMVSWLAIPLALILGRAIGVTGGRALNPLLAGTARLTLLFSLLFAFGLAL